jgi:hypothetical protein
MRTLIVAATFALLSGCVATDQLSTQLQQGMTEAEVVAKAGKPNSVSLNTCGTAAGLTPWTCKQYTYHGMAGHQLVVTFSEKSGVWLVNNWNAY